MFSPLDLRAASMNPGLIRPTPVSLRAGHPKYGCWQMAWLNCGMTPRAGAGVGFFQLRVVSAPIPGYVMIGLVPVGASVVDHKYPGSPTSPQAQTGAFGWSGNSTMRFNQLGWATASHLKRLGGFGQDDRVMLVLDCRGDPVVCLLVNSQPRWTCALPAITSGCALCPAIALFGNSEPASQPCVELEAAAVLPVGWDVPPRVDPVHIVPVSPPLAPTPAPQHPGSVQLPNCVLNNHPAGSSGVHPQVQGRVPQPNLWPWPQQARPTHMLSPGFFLPKRLTQGSASVPLRPPPPLTPPPPP